MTELKPTTQNHTQCDCALGMDCAVYAPGHAMQFIQERVASASPSKWRDALVDHVAADGWVALRTINDSAQVWVWHHADLSDVVRVGDPVAIHGLYHVLALGRERFNVRVSDEALRQVG